MGVWGKRVELSFSEGSAPEDAEQSCYGLPKSLQPTAVQRVKGGRGVKFAGSPSPPHPTVQPSHSTSPNTPNFITAHPHHNRSRCSVF